MEHFYQNIQGWFNFSSLYSKIAKQLPINGIFVEVGVWKGKSFAYFVVELLNTGKKANLYAVDTWEGSEEHSKEECIVNNTLFAEFTKNIMPVCDNIKALKMTSVEASLKFDNNSIDCVFIDASHDYQNVINDINAWYPKVKHGGIISGHDYDWPIVYRAVNDYFKNKCQVLKHETCWVVSKP